MLNAIIPQTTSNFNLPLQSTITELVLVTENGRTYYTVIHSDEKTYKLLDHSAGRTPREVVN